MATKTHDNAALRALRRKLDDVRRDDDTGTRSLFVQAMEKFLSAADYPDLALMQSYLEEAKCELGVLLTTAVDALADRSTAARSVVQQFTDLYEGEVVTPDEHFDELGRSLSQIVSNRLLILRDFKGGEIATALKHSVEVPNAAKLDGHIAYWEGVKTDLVDRWPWTDAPLPFPPVDREMVARSRAAIVAGELGEEIDALVARLRSQ
jgi:hypothetical protein